MMTGVLLATVAGSTIFFGLMLARWRGASERLRAVLALVSAGVVLFLVVDVGHQAVAAVEVTVHRDLVSVALQRGLLFVCGFGAGLIGLAWFEGRRLRNHAIKKGALEVATIIATGIGLHNFALGLAIGQSFAGGELSLGAPLLVGFALHNATEGFGIAGLLVGQNVSWRQLFSLGLIAGAPTVFGAALGGMWVSPAVELLCLSIATGSLIYVVRELLRMRSHTLGAVAQMTAIALGFLLGFIAELIVGSAYAYGD